MNIVRQGDITLIQSGSIPAGMKEVAQSCVVGLGEVTGHRHEVINARWLVPNDIDVDDLKQFAVSGSLSGFVFVVAEENASIRHLTDSGTLTGEHDTISLNPGVWQVVRQSEYAPAVIRTVLD